MASEDLTPQQKLGLAQTFVDLAPPAQESLVLDDVRTLVGASVLTADKEQALLAKAHKAKFAVCNLEGKKVLLTPHAELPGGLFLDPSGPCAFTVDHKTLTGSKAAQPLSPAQQQSISSASALRAEVDGAMQAYCRDYLPSGVVTTYGSTGAGVTVVSCISAKVAELSNYWAGSWTSEWTLEVPAGGAIGQLTGNVKCDVHYFEDGNVQLDDKIVFQCELPAGAGEAWGAFAGKLREFEQGALAKLEDIYTNMSESVLQGLRRRLPVTRTKFDWDKQAVARLAQDLQKAAAIS